MTLAEIIAKLEELEKRATQEPLFLETDGDDGAILRADGKFYFLDKLADQQYFLESRKQMPRLLSALKAQQDALLACERYFYARREMNGCDERGALKVAEYLTDKCLAAFEEKA